MRKWKPPRQQQQRPQRAVKATPRQRLAICQRCPQMTRDWRCTHCGCFMQVKTRMAASTCPERKW